MANLTVYSVKKLSMDDFKIFTGLYNDFRSRAVSDFKFDLEPLEYEDFIMAINNGLLQCLVLFENSIPTGFLIYTTLISYAIELNIIYLISQDNYETKVKNLVEELLNIEKDRLNNKVITYPLLGEQVQYKDILEAYNFNIITQSVLKFDFLNPSSVSKISHTRDLDVPLDFYIDNWNDEYFESACKIIYNNFKTASDALFDTRFKSLEGTKDVVAKVVNSTYGQFLPKYSKVVLKNDKPIAVCFVNVTGNGLVNIPLVAVDKLFRNQKLGKNMVSKAVREILEDTLNGVVNYSEVNVTTDFANTAALRMYEFCGFVEDYKYLQSFKE